MHTVVVLYEVNTQAIQIKSLATRTNDLIEAVEAASTYLNVALPQGASPLRAIFLGPEYLFSRAITNIVRGPVGGFQKISRPGDHFEGDRRQMGEEETAKLRQNLASLSTAFRDALLIPGSVAWRKTIATQQARLKYMTTIRQTDHINMEMVQGQRFGPTTTVFPQQFEPNPLRSVPTSKSKHHELRTSAVYVAKNTAHCYFNGACLFKYNKIGDFHEVQDNSDTVHVPSGQAGRFAIPSIPWMHFGVAICYDQSLSMQIDGPSGEPWKYALQMTGQPVDFHILLSAHIAPFVQAANLKPGGHLLSCSSSTTCNGVLHQANGALKPIHSLNKGGANMEFFLVKSPNGPSMFSLKVYGASDDDSLMLEYRVRSRAAPLRMVSGRLGSLGVADIQNFQIADAEISFPGHGPSWSSIVPGRHYMFSSGRYSYVCS